MEDDVNIEEENNNNGYYILERNEMMKSFHEFKFQKVTSTVKMLE